MNRFQIHVFQCPKSQMSGRIEKSGKRTRSFMLCQPALFPGEVCHPSRFNWTTYSSEYILHEALVVGRDFCPYVMPCEPSEACDYNNTCSQGYVSRYNPYCLVMRLVLVCSVTIYILSYPLACVLQPDVECVTFRQNPHFRLDGKCVPCPAVPWLLPAGMVFVCLCGAIGMFLLNRSGINLSILSVGIDYFQTLSIIIKLFTPLPPGVVLPFDIRLIIKWMLVFQMDLDMTGPECALEGF